MKQGKNIQWRNAGGYGFWCNKACAERKDAEKKAELERKLSQQQIIEGLTAPQKNDNTIYLIAGLGILLLTFSGVAIYMANKPKN